MAGRIVSVDFAVDVDPTVAAGITELRNTAAITGASPDVDPSNNTSSTVTPLVAAPDLRLAKSDSGQTTGAGAAVRR